MIDNDSNIRLQTVSKEFVSNKLAGTPLSDYSDLIYRLAIQYDIDVNWVLAYLQMESAFGRTSPAPTNPWDIQCFPGQFGEIGEVPYGDHCAAVYPSLEVGLEAGFRLWSSYADRGWDTWFKSLSVSLCGNPAGCPGDWVRNTIGQANYNIQQDTGIIVQQPQVQHLPVSAPSQPEALSTRRVTAFTSRPNILPFLFLFLAGAFLYVSSSQN